MVSRMWGKLIVNVLVGAAAFVFVGARFLPGTDRSGPVLSAAKSLVGVSSGEVTGTGSTSATLLADTKAALGALATVVRPLSSPLALEDAFRSYFAFKASHPGDVKKPYLYFVDYGLPSTAARGYVFDMSSLTVIDGPFTVAHGRGSSTSRYGVPTRFSNASGSEATSLGLYLAANTYAFHGKTGGASYSSIGLKLDGVSEGFNDNAFARGVVAHGAPYVTPTKAGRSEGCPAMEPTRAAQLLPKLANGGMVFLFAPDQRWLSGDQWLSH